MWLDRSAQHYKAVSVQVTLADGRTVVALAGALDIATAPEVAVRLRSLAQQGPVELDLGGVGFMDAAALRSLRRVAAVAAEHGHRVRVRSPVSPAVEALLGALKLDVDGLLGA
ncbi:MAG TPA: STAS domain-containing protein [Solirubrobacteraceae bacterium]|jgi:anti-anti-sigma factor|nr:STAS domain-containing protein [Solirubrobacteraceae bacterium]